MKQFLLGERREKRNEMVSLGLMAFEWTADGEFPQQCPVLLHYTGITLLIRCFADNLVGLGFL